MILLALLGCTPGSPLDTGDPWVDPCPVLSLGAEEVRIDDTAPGEEGEARLPITNDCPGEAWLVVDARLEGDESLLLRDASVTVRPGDTQDLFVYFAPTDLYEASATLVLHAHGLDEVQVGVVGNPWDDPSDMDRDGWANPEHGGEDCDDADPEVHPDAPEQDNGVDDDCDGLVDEDFVRDGDVRVDELMIDPLAASDFFGEYIELTNASARDWLLDGWVIEADGGQSIPLQGMLERNQCLLLATHADPDQNGGLDPDLVYSTDDLALDNQAGSLRLTVEGRVISEVTWEAEAWGDEWAEGASLSRDPLREGWCLSTSRIPGGDLGTPGAANDLCDGLVDADGDGYTPVDGDCDDDDPAVNPGATEVWGDWTDNDCDGTADLASIDSLGTGWIEGSVYVDPDLGPFPDELGYHDQLGAADVDGDGRAELLVGGWSGSAHQGRVWLLDGVDHATWSGAASSLAMGSLTGELLPPYSSGGYPYPVGPNQLGAVDHTPGDVSGDGVPDLVVAGTGDHWLQWDPGRQDPALVVLEGGPGLGAHLVPDDADLRVVLNVSGSRNVVLSSSDLDGDGIADIVYGEPESIWADGSGGYVSAGGQAGIFLGGTHSGVVEDVDADALWRGASGDRVGSSLAGTDLDGDGYGDLVLGARGTDKRAKDAGSIYVLDGSAILDGGAPESAARAAFRGASRYDRLGARPSPRLGDLDGDGALDLVASSYNHDRVWVFSNLASASGATHAGYADITLENHAAPYDFGIGLAVGDMSGDGRDDLCVGAAGDDSIPATWATTEGRVYCWRALDQPTLESESAHLTLVGVDVEDGFGMGLLAADLDGDGTDELVVDAPGAASEAGIVYVVSLD